MDKILFSSKTDDWATPQYVFDWLNNIFNFELDPCASKENHKCDKYYTKEIDGLSQKWGGTKYFAILHMEEKSATGLKKHMKKTKKIIILLFCFCRLGQIQNGIMNIFAEMLKFFFSKGVLNLEMKKTALHFLV